jgi:hypothetical protein
MLNLYIITLIKFEEVNEIANLPGYDIDFRKCVRRGIFPP